MEILFKSAKLRKQLIDEKLRLRQFGQVRAEKIQARLDDMDAAQNLEAVRNLPGQYHELSGDRAGQLATSLNQPYRLIFEPAHDPLPMLDNGGLDWAAVTAVRIIEIVDYHD